MVEFYLNKLLFLSFFQCVYGLRGLLQNRFDSISMGRGFGCCFRHKSHLSFIIYTKLSNLYQSFILYKQFLSHEVKFPYLIQVELTKLSTTKVSCVVVWSCILYYINNTNIQRTLRYYLYHQNQGSHVYFHKQIHMFCIFWINA